MKRRSEKKATDEKKKWEEKINRSASRSWKREKGKEMFIGNKESELDNRVKRSCTTVKKFHRLGSPAITVLSYSYNI